MKTDCITALSDLFSTLDSAIREVGISSEANFCGSCSRCCHYLYRFPVSSLELEYIAHIYGDREHPPEFVDFLNGRNSNPDGTPVKCPYCSDSGCTIYLARPMCCRLYGLSPYRPLLENCIFRSDLVKAHNLWRELVPLFKKFIDIRFSYYDDTHETLVPQTVTDFLDRGNMFLVRNDLEKAFRDFNEALSINQNDAISHSYLGAFYEAAGDDGKAWQEYTRALELDPLDYSTHIKLGLLHHGRNQLQEAYDHYMKALGIDPYNAQIWGNLGLLYITLQKWQEAEDAYRKALDLEPLNSVYHVCLGNVWYAMNDIPRTIGQMQKALEINPSEDIAYLCLGSIYERKGKIKKAIKQYQSFLGCTADKARKTMIEGKVEALQFLLRTGRKPTPPGS